jgi:uncharacterized protein (TIGR03083 family)
MSRTWRTNSDRATLDEPIATTHCTLDGVSIIVSSYAATARAVGDLVDQIPERVWDSPGLGEWNLRDLVGHTSRSLVTVIEYLARPVGEEVLNSASAYLTVTAAALSDGTFEASAVTERGRQAGQDLGADPASRFRELAEEAIQIAEKTDPELVVHTIVGGMRVASYLPTRTFELCVHGLDISAATGIAVNLPEVAVEEAASLAAVTAAQRGLGTEVLLAMTGRLGLPEGFSVV